MSCLTVYRAAVQYEKRTKANITFESLPAEIHVGIAEQCEQPDLFNICLVSLSMNRRCSHVLYRHVDLLRDQPSTMNNLPKAESNRIYDVLQRQHHLISTLLCFPEYGQCVRSIRTKLGDGFTGLRGQDAGETWQAMRTLTQLHSVELGSRTKDSSYLNGTTPLPRNLFQSATSVTLVGHMEYNVAKAILNALDSARLTYLCLNMVQENDIENFSPVHVPGNLSEDGRIVAYGATTGLLKLLTGRCSALRTLILRRRGQIENGPQWHAAAEDASYMEWGSFLCSVQSTVEQFTFEQAARWTQDAERKGADSTSRIMDDRFRRLILSAIVSRSWPCLTLIELQGVRSQDGGAGLTMELRAAVGANAKIVVKERPLHVLESFEMISEQYQNC